MEVWSQRSRLMDDTENYSFRLSRSQRVSDLRTVRGNYDTVSISIVVAPSSQSSVATLII